MFNNTSPEYFVEWVKKRFFQITPEDLKKSEFLNAVKSWIAVGNEHCSSYLPWIAQRTYMFLVCYMSGVDIIDDCLDIELAAKILRDGVNNCKLNNANTKNLKKEFVRLANVYITEKYRSDEQLERFLVHHFACYTVLLNKIKKLESFRNEY